MTNTEAIITIRFLTTEEGGRQTPIKSNKYCCTLMIDDKQGFDCRFVLNRATLFELGKEYEIEIKFLNEKKALKNLREGQKIYLWEGKKIGTGVLKKIFGPHCNPCDE